MRARNERWSSGGWCLQQDFCWDLLPDMTGQYRIGQDVTAHDMI
jgi:hypothetical protein